jgi:integrase
MPVPERQALSWGGGGRQAGIDVDRATIRFREKGGKLIVKPIPGELLEILQAADEQGLWIDPNDYVIPNRRPAKNAERSHKVIYDTVKKVAERARVATHVHALRSAFAVRFDDQHPREVIALNELLGHSRIETTMLYLRRKDKARAMEAVRDLSWSPLPPSRLVPPAGFEPALPPWKGGDLGR